MALNVKFGRVQRDKLAALNQSTKPKAIVVDIDIDETKLDHIPYVVELINDGRSFDFMFWMAWGKIKSSGLKPGCKI